MIGRFFSSAAWYFAATAASAAPSMRSTTLAGLHCSLPFTCASQCALHSALISGGFTSPEHFGAFISAVHEPLHVPSHFALAFSSHVPPHLPLHSPLAFASHLPSHVPLH